MRGPAHVSSSDLKRVLFISYPFPPVGGAGVQRTTKFVKYLSEFGWLPSVLTVANPSVPALDHSLLLDVPRQVNVIRARTWEPGYAAKAAVSSDSANKTGSARGLKSRLKRAIHRLAQFVLQPDPQILWMPHAVRDGKRLLREVPHDAIVASGPPFSTFLIAARLSRRCGVPLVLDYRDEWDISNAYLENKRRDQLSLFLQSRMQDHVVRAASAMVATTRHSADALRRIRDRTRSEAAIDWVYNGFDPDDFVGIESPPAIPKKSYRLAYIGTLWNLTDVSPLVAGVEELSRSSPALAEKLELLFAGRRTPQQSEILGRLKSLPCRLIEYPYVDHKGAVELTKSADGLCVLLSDVPAADRVVPAKIFECMAAKRAIFAIGPFGEMWDLLEKTPAAIINQPGDVKAIAASLAAEITRVTTGQPLDLGDFNPSAYDRRSQAKQLAHLLDGIT